MILIKFQIENHFSKLLYLNLFLKITKKNGPQKWRKAGYQPATRSGAKPATSRPRGVVQSRVRVGSDAGSGVPLPKIDWNSRAIDYEMSCKKTCSSENCSPSEKWVPKILPLSKFSCIFKETLREPSLRGDKISKTSFQSGYT